MLEEMQKINMMKEDSKLETLIIKKVEESYIFLKEIEKLKLQ
jgi:hypothetical protein